MFKTGIKVTNDGGSTLGYTLKDQPVAEVEKFWRSKDKDGNLGKGNSICYTKVLTKEDRVKTGSATIESFKVAHNQALGDFIINAAGERAALGEEGEICLPERMGIKAGVPYQG